MKTLFVPAYSRKTLNKSKFSKVSKKLPNEIAIAYSIQYKKIAQEIKQEMSQTHNITKFIQVLGCTKPNFSKQTKAILLISNGKFHAVSLALESKLPVYLLDHDNLTLISKEDIKKLEQQRKVSYLKFLHSDKVGIIISTKPGQQNLKKALELKKKLKQKAYLFLSNNIDASEFENFQLDCWINSACPRMDMASKDLINIGNLNI
jgi:diphthamide biosynthesis enzyme Dph1/Dph2-like protein